MKRNSGQALISALVSLGISAIVMMVVAQMINDQSVFLKYFTQKTETIQLGSLIFQQLNSPAVCNWQFANANSGGVVNTNDPAATPEVNFTALYSGLNAISPVLVDVATTNLSGAKVESIKLKNFEYTGVPGRYTAELVIALDNTTLVRTLPPVKIKKILSIDSVAGSTSARPIAGCTVTTGPMVVGAQDPGIQPGGINQPSKTGTQACAELGRSCSRVTSLNSIIVDAGCPSATHCIHVCMFWYNRSLPGVTNTTAGVTDNNDNIHSCDAQLGFWTTYLHPGVVECAGFFSAICE